LNQPSLFGDESPAAEPPAPKPGGARREVRPLPEPLAEPAELPGRLFPAWQRVGGAVELEALFAEYAAGKATADEVYRFLRGSLYLLDADELLRVGGFVADLLRGET
jgi:hypothetical protein